MAGITLECRQAGPAAGRHRWLWRGLSDRVAGETGRRRLIELTQLDLLNHGWFQRSPAALICLLGHTQLALCVNDRL